MAKKNNGVPKLVAIAEKLREVSKADAKNVYAYGELLTDANALLEYGKWLPWIEEFGISEQSARNYMAAHRFKLAVMQMPMFKSTKFGDLMLRPSAIYMLAGILEAITDGREQCPIDIADIEAVLMAAKDAWVGPKRLEAILCERHSSEPEAVTPRPPAFQPTPEPTPEPQPTPEPISDKPPDPNPTPATTSGEQSTLIRFMAAVLELKKLTTKPAEKFADTEVPVEVLENVADFVRHVSKVVIAKKMPPAAPIPVTESAS
ncbi:MAG: hypothetical protein ACLPTZ_07440 [Beijerinckiaceae bacterium]|jgi:hypothetical protein